MCSVVAGGAQKITLYINCVLLFVGALLSWRLVLANRRILVVFGGGLECSVVAGEASENRCTLVVFCFSLVHCFLGGLC